MGTCTIKHRMNLTPLWSDPHESLPVLQQSLPKCSITKKKTTHVSIKWISYLLVVFRQDTSCILFGGLNLSSDSSFLWRFFSKKTIPLSLVSVWCTQLNARTAIAAPCPLTRGQQAALPRATQVRKHCCGAVPTRSQPLGKVRFSPGLTALADACVSQDLCILPCRGTEVQISIHIYIYIHIWWFASFGLHFFMRLSFCPIL